VGDRAGHLRAAPPLLEEHGVSVTAASSLYETDPVGPIPDQPDFLNAALRVQTALEPQELYQACKAIEIEQGRIFAGPRQGPRALDIDLLLLGDIEMETERLTLPHKGVISRRFVLVPLLEIEPELKLPDGTDLAKTLEELGPGERVELVEPL
jgi:2-amino-4-hydroxy-6-hydroxymethyldihydropteridine diphosphokinase